MESRICVLLLGILVITTAQDIQNHRKKRQIYREHVLPHAGGRIPDTAFQTDRLFLNRLQKDGVSVPDGVVTEQRNPQVYPFLSKPMREVYRVALSSDDRFTGRAGRYQQSGVPSIETTYLFPQVVGQPLRKHGKNSILPIYKQIQFPTVSEFNQAKLQQKNGEPLLKILPKQVGNKNVNNAKIQSFQNFNIIHETPSSSNSRSSYRSYFPDYDSTRRLFNDFDSYFDSFYTQPVTKKLNNPLQI